LLILHAVAAYICRVVPAVGGSKLLRNISN